MKPLKMGPERPDLRLALRAKGSLMRAPRSPSYHNVGDESHASRRMLLVGYALLDAAVAADYNFRRCHHVER
jgi:hypothetical protein